MGGEYEGAPHHDSRVRDSSIDLIIRIERQLVARPARVGWAVLVAIERVALSHGPLWGNGVVILSLRRLTEGQHECRDGCHCQTQTHCQHALPSDFHRSSQTCRHCSPTGVAASRGFQNGGLPRSCDALYAHLVFVLLVQSFTCVGCGDYGAAVGACFGHRESGIQSSVYFHVVPGLLGSECC